MFLLVCEGRSTCEEYLVVCLVGSAVRRNYARCLVIVVIFMRFEQAGAKWCGGCLKVISWMGWQCKSQKRDSFYREGRFSLCNSDVLWNCIVGLDNVKYFIEYLFSLYYYCCFTCLRLAGPKVQFKVS